MMIEGVFPLLLCIVIWAFLLVMFFVICLFVLPISICLVARKHYEEEHDKTVTKEELKETNISNKPLQHSANAPGNKTAPVEPVAEECSICLMDTVEKGCVIPCGHAKFCLECLKKCGETCPICRTKIDNKIRVF